MRKKPLILCVDDQLASIQISLALLYEAGCDILAVEDHASAMQIVTTESVDLIFLNFRLANGERGDLLANEIRTSSPRIPIVMFIGANALPENARRSVDAVIMRPGNDARVLFDVLAKFVPNIPLHPRGSDIVPKSPVAEAS